MLKSLFNYWETTKHRWWVFYYSLKFSLKLLRRAIVHDLSKYSSKEASFFADNTPKLKKTTYGSKEYKKNLKNLKPALDHHYKINSHHPEHFDFGFRDMSGLDRIEMLMDWLAATKRHEDGDINRSVKVNKKRFEYSNNDEIWLEKIAEELK